MSADPANPLTPEQRAEEYADRMEAHPENWYARSEARAGWLAGYRAASGEADQARKNYDALFDERNRLGLQADRLRIMLVGAQEDRDKEEIARVSAERRVAALRLAGERVSGALAWIDARRQRLHAEDCSVHEPSAQCSCGLHRVLTDLRAVINSADALSTPQGDAKGNANG